MDKLKQMKPGESGEVTGYEQGSGAYRTRLLAMGLTKSTRFTVKSVAPMGDPVEIEIRGSRLTLRKGEADALIVRRINA